MVTGERNVTTVVLDGVGVAAMVEETLPGALDATVTEGLIYVKPDFLVEVALSLRDDPRLDLRFLSSVTGLDWWTHFEVVYHLYSLELNHGLVVKVRLDDHENPIAPSVVPVWYGAHLQEREVYDLMGIRFEGHPRMERIFLWDGFPGYPLRKDWLAMPGNLKPGLAHFPNEIPKQHPLPNVPDTGE
jgi:NADH-quinone oxidoreductase subunit C